MGLQRLRVVNASNVVDLHVFERFEAKSFDKGREGGDESMDLMSRKIENYGYSTLETIY